MRNVKYGTRNTMHKGFSFIEVMLSVFLMSAGMVAAISLIGAGLKESIDSRNQLIASLLSQEGVELVRNIRDNNWADGNPSFAGIGTSNNCAVSVSTALTCSSPVTTLNYNWTNHVYSHNTGAGETPTKFSRQIRLVDSGNDKIVTSIVIWKGSFSDIADIITECTTGAGCSYAQLTLTRWNE